MTELNQIDAALGLLGRNRKDIAGALTIPEGTLYSYFGGKAAIPAARLRDIQAWLEHQGVEFIEGGARLRRSNIREFKGQSGFWAFYDDIYETVRTSGGSILISGVDDAVFLKWLGPKAKEHHDRMSELNNFTMKSIIREGDKNASASYGDIEYRSIETERFSDIPFYLYGNKTGIIEFKENDVWVSVIDSPRIHEAFRNFFFATWKRASQFMAEGV